MRLDYLLHRELRASGKEARALIARGAVVVNGKPAEHGGTPVGHFDQVSCEDRDVQARVRKHLMLNKPAGVVSATKDREHPTVMDLIGGIADLHLAGRLDRFSTGLVILTNDGEFSEGLTLPGKKIGKRYVVGVDGEISDEAIGKFETGVWFQKEEVCDRPGGGGAAGGEGGEDYYF